MNSGGLSGPLTRTHVFVLCSAGTMTRGAVHGGPAGCGNGEAPGQGMQGELRQEHGAGAMAHDRDRHHRVSLGPDEGESSLRPMAVRALFCFGHAVSSFFGGAR